jgi:predicted transcriptional regulator
VSKDHLSKANWANASRDFALIWGEAIRSAIKVYFGMVQLPNHRPKHLSLGPLEAEILQIVWELGTVTVKAVHDRILSDPNRELAYASVTTVLNRLAQKGWLACDKQGRSFAWRSLVSREEARALQAYEQLNQFLAVGNPDIVAAFADRLDQSSLDQLDAIAQRLQAIRQAREEKS